MEKGITGACVESFEDARYLRYLLNDPEILKLLALRNQNLSQFHFENQ